MADVVPLFRSVHMPRRKVVPIKPPTEEIQEPPPELPDELLKVEEVMSKFKISRTEVYYLMQAGMPHYKLGRTTGKKTRNLRFVKAELATWFHDQKVP
jgi:predicted DNA-binding transcriptional regulator AlpA